MNILFLYNTVFDPEKGGIWRVSAVLADYFEKNGARVWYVSLAPKKPNVPHPTRQFMLPDSSSYDAPRNQHFFSRFIDEKNIDILINQAFQGPQDTFQLVQLAKKKGCKVFGVHHSTPLGKMKNFRAVFEKRVLFPFRWLLILTDLTPIKRMLFLMYRLKYGNYFKKLCKESDRVVLLSEKFKQEFLYLTDGLYKDKLTSIPNPVSFISEYPCYAGKEKELLFVGRLVMDHKRPDLLLRIWEKLCNRFPDWKLTLVGDGPALEKLKEYAKKKKLLNIRFEGYKNPQPYYERASIFCLTSSFEGFGLVLTEAMQCGVVPFAFNSYASVTDIIDNEKNGILVTPFDVDEYAKKLEQLMTNEKLLQKMAWHTRVKSKDFSIEKIGERWLTLMNSTLTGWWL